MPRALSGIQIYPRQLTYALTSWDTGRLPQEALFRHALNGPFDNPRFLPGSQLPGTLCMARNCLYSRLNGLEQYSTSEGLCQGFFSVGSDQSRT